MFTGIITKKIKVGDIIKTKNSLEIIFDLPKGIFLEEGESVSLNGICSTVAKHSKDNFQIHYMKETLDNTKAKNLKVGDPVNFEQSLKWNDKVSGHFVSGHIDCVGKVVSIEKKKGWVLKISIPAKFMKYVALKGSISIDGVSLTVSKVTKTGFEVSLIPYTIEHTTLGDLSKGNLVNIETDLLAKYLPR
ncbi:MAG: riboflavin synthase [Candidatus Paceibacterota bacterium]